MEPEPVGNINFMVMFPNVENHGIRYVLHICGIRDIPSHSRIIELEGIDKVNDLAIHEDTEIDRMAERSSKRTNQRVQFGLKRTKYLNAVCHWVRKNRHEGVPNDVRMLTPALIADLIHEMAMQARKKDSDSKLYYPEAFSATDYKNWIKKVKNYLDSRTGKSGVPLSFVIRPADVDPAEASDEYTWVMCAASFHTPQYKEDNREVYHLFKDLLTKTERATWFEKVKDGDGRAAHLLLREHNMGEAHDMRRAASANAKLEMLFWKSEASFTFEKFLTRMNEAFKELEDAGQPLFETQKAKWLLRGIKNDDIQVQTTIGIFRNSFLSDFDSACLTLSRTVSARFASVEANRHKRGIGAINTAGRGGVGRGRGRSRGSGGRSGGRQGGGCMKVTMNGVNVTDVTRNFTSDEWEKLKACKGHTYVYQRRDFLNGRTNGREGRGGQNGSGGRSHTGGGREGSHNGNEQRNVSVTNTASTEIVEYDAFTSTIASQSSLSGRGDQSGPRRTD
jgi:hypothetical protein